MATQDDKPQTTPVTEREKEDKEFLTEVTGIPVTKLPLAEMKQVEPPHDDIQVSYESKNGEMNNEPDSSNLNKDENGGSVHDSSSLDSIDATSVHNAELYNVGREAYFEDCGTVTKLITTTASFEGDPHETSFPAKEAKSSEISSTPEDTMLDPEILHSSVSVVDEITEKDDNSDLSKSTSTQTACQSDHLEERKENAQTAEIQPASHVITLTTTDPSAGTAGPGNRNYEVKSTDDATDDSNDDVGISSHSEYPNKEEDKKAKENGDSNKEQLSSPLVAESTEETISQNMDLDKVDQLEGNSGTINEGGQERSKLSLDMKERIRNELEILGADNLESSISESQNSSCDKPESIREVSDIVLTSKESQPKEIHRDDTEEMMQQKEEVSSEEHKFTSQGSQNMESKSGEDLQVKNTISMSPKDEADYKNDQEIRGSENIATDLEEDQSNRRTTESAKEGGSRQQFQIIVKANKAVDEANNPELLPIKDLSTVASDEIPEAVIREAAKDVIWEQKEVPITKESEEVTKRNDELADATNLLSQSSDENSKNYQAIQEADDCTDNTNISRMPAEEEKGLKEVHVDDKSLATSDIVSQEKPLGNNSRSNTGLSSEEVGDVKLENNLGLALQLQTTESEHADKDHISIENSSLTENEAAENARTDEEYRSQDQCVKKLLESGDNQTVKCDGENKIEEDSCKGITTAVPKSESNDAVIETKVGSDQNSSAAKVVDIVEVIPSMMLRKGEEYETSNILENKKDETTNTNEDIVNETSNASFATNFDKELLQKDENESPSIKEIQEENDGMEASEAEGKEHVSEVDDPATIASEHRMELPVEKETEDEKSLNSDDTRKNGDQSGISQSLGKGNQPNKEDQQYEEATELFMRPDEVLQSKVDIENSQVFTKANETEINKGNLEGATTEIGDTILIEKSNEIQEILLNDQSVEKIGNKHRGTEDSSCCSPPEEINQKSDQEDDLKLEADPGAKADGIFVATNNTSSNTKFEEPKTTDATESFKKEMPTEEKFGEGPSQVSEADETVKYSITEEGKEKRNVNDSTNYDEFKQEVDPEVKADETTNTASQSTKTEEPETIYTTQSFQKQDEEQVVEGSYQTAEEILPYNHRQEETKERNVISTKKKDEFKAEIDKGITADEISESINDASNSTKFEEAETIEATQSFNNNKVGEGCWQIAEQTENHSPEEEGKEERNVKEKTASDELKPEMHTGEKFEEPEALEATQRLNTPMPSEDPVVEGPFQGSIAEDVINYSTVEEGKEERNDIHTTGDDIKPESDPEVKVDEISATTSNASQSIKFEGTEIFDATQSFKEQSPTEGKGVEEPCQVSTAEEIVNYIPVEEAKEERNVKDTAIQEELNPELAPGTKPHEISETINNASFQDPEPIEAIQSVNKQIPSEENVIELPDQVSAEEEIVNYIPVAEAKEERNVMDTAIQEELNPELAPGTKPHEISDTINNARFQEPEPIDAIQSVNKQIPSEEKVIEQPGQVSAEEEIVNYIPVAEAKEERNVKDKEIQEELNPELTPGTKPHEISETINNASFQEPAPIDAIQSVNKQIPSEEKVIELPDQVSAEEEIVNYIPVAEAKEERNVMDTAIQEELNPELAPGTKPHEISETINNASVSTKFQEPAPIDAIQSVNKQIASEEKFIEQPDQVSAEEEIENYIPVAEAKEERNVKDTAIQEELNPELAPGTKPHEISETINNASFQEPAPIDAIQSVNKQIPSEEEVIELPDQVSAEEGIVNYIPVAEAKEERNVMDTAIQEELNPELAPGTKPHEISDTINNASVSTKFQEPAPIDAIQSVNKQIASEEKVIEQPDQVSAEEEIENYIPVAEAKEERNVKDTAIQEELNPEIAPGTKPHEISETINNASFQEPAPIDAIQSVNKQIPSEEKVIEQPDQVSAEEEIVNYIPVAEAKEERNVKDKAIQEELNPELAPGTKPHEISETINNASFQEPVPIDAIQSVNKQIASEEKVIEQPDQVSAEEEIENYIPVAEAKEERNVKDTAIQEELNPELAPGTKPHEISETINNASFQEPEPIDAIQSVKKQIASEEKVIEQPDQVSAEEEIVNYIPVAEAKEERNVKDKAIQEELNPELAPGTKPHEISETINNASFQEPSPIDAIQSVNKQIASEEKVIEQPGQVSAIEEIVNYHESAAEEIENYHLAENELKDAKDTITVDELQPKVDPGGTVDEISDTTHYASESTKFEDPKTVDATQSFTKWTTREGQVGEGPPHVSTADDAVNYSPVEEEKEEGNVKDATHSYELNPDVDQGENVKEESETIEIASESAKFEEPHCIDVSRSFQKDIPSEDEAVEGPHRVSTEEKIVNYSLAEEGKAESNTKQTITRDELKSEVDPKVELEVPEIIEATLGINTQMPSEDKVVEGTPQASIAVDVGNYRPAEERKEDRNVNNTTADELPTRIELEETNSTNVTQSFEKEIPRKGKIVEGPCQVSAEEEPVTDNSAEEGEERNVIDAATQDELKPEVAPGIKLDEISENMKNANESAKLQQPESLDATQSISKQINSDDKVVAGSHHIVTAEEIVNYHLADEGEAKDVKDTTLVDEYHELKAKIESEVMADEISETHYASESTKSTEPGTVEATTSFQEEMPKEDKVVEGPPKVSTAEEIVNYSPAEEEKEERNVKDPTISDVLKPEEDPEEISPFIDNASQITKLEGCETAEVSLSFNKEMQSEDDVVEGPPQVSTPEEISYEEEGKAERNVKETTARGELKTEADQKIEGDETSETTNSTSKTPEFELPENIEATKGVHTQILSEDKIDEGPIQVSIAEDVGTCNLEEERNDKNVDHETRDVSPTRIKLEGSSVTDATQGFEKEIPRKDKVVEQLFQVSTAEELVTDSPAEEGKEERNLTDAASQDESGKRLYEMSKTMKNFQVPEPIDDTQSVKEQVASEEKVIEGPHHVSTVEETVIYHLADEGEEKNVKDTTTTDELNLKVESGIRADEISETHYASESTKFKEAESVDATTSFQEQMLKEGKVVEGPPRVSTAEEIVNYSPAGEEKEERNVKDTTISNDLKPEVDPGAKLNEISETKDNSSESANFKEPERIDVTKSFNKEVQIEDEVVDGHPQVSTAEEIVNHSCAEEGKAERNFNETATRDELNTEVNPKVEVDEIYKTTKSASETKKFEAPETIEAIQGISTPSEDKVVEEPFQVPIAEDVGNYRREEEREEDRNDKNTIADLPTGIKLEETDQTDVTQCSEKQISSNDQAVEGPCQVSIAEELVNLSPSEEGQQERSVMEASTQDELKQEVAPEIKPDEILETLKNANESTQFQEPETIGATQSSNTQMTYEDRNVEGPHQVSTAEGIDNYSLAQGEEWNVKDTRALDELKAEVNPEAPGDAISEPTYYASRSTKFEEPDTVDANQSFKKQISGESRVVEEPPQDPNAEEMLDSIPAEERKEELNIKDTTLNDDLKPEVNPGLKVDIINSTSQSTKLEDDETMHVAKNCNKQMQSEDKVVEWPPQISTAEEIQNHSPAEEGKEESSVKDISAREDLEVYPIVKADEISGTTNNATETTKFEEPETIDAIQSSKKQIPSAVNVVGGSCDVSTTKEIMHYNSGEEGEETNVKDTTTAVELKTKEDTRGKADEISASSNKFDETETIDATQSFKKQMPSEDKVVEGNHQSSTMVEIVNSSAAEEEKEERNVKDTTTKLELQEKTDKLPNTNTETEITTPNEKVEVPEVGFPKYDEGPKGCNDQEKIFRNDLEETARESSEKLGEYIVSEAETLKPVHAKIEDYPISKDVAKEDTNTLESHKDDEQTQYSPSESLYEITNVTGLGLEKQEGGVDKDVTLLLSGTSGYEESNKLDNEEHYPSQANSFTDEEKEEKVEEQENLSTSTGVIKLDGDEFLSKRSEKEEKKFQNQNQKSDFPFAGEESEREIQGEIKELHHGTDPNVVASEVQGESGGKRKTSDECEETSSSIKSDLISEVKVRGRSTEEILIKAEHREDKDQDDTSMKEISQKDELADLMQATNNSANSDMSCKSSIAMSDLEITAKEGPETGIESKLLSEDKEFSVVQNGPSGETLHPEIELKPGDASQAVAEAVKAEYGEREQLNDDCNEQTENFRSAISEENSPSELEQSRQETPREQGDGETQDQQRNITYSTLEIARNKGPMDDAAIKMDTNLPLDMQKLEVAPSCEFHKQVEEADPNDSSIDTQDLPEVQQKATAESSYAGGENQKPVECSEDKETEEATGKSILEEKSMTSLPKVHTSSIDTKDLPEVQQKATAEASCAEGENQEPVECSEDKETEEATGKSILEEKSMNSLPEVHISSVDTQDLPEVQQKETAETSCAEGENQEPVECSEDKETEEVTGKSILEEKSMTSLPKVHISSIDTKDLPEVQQKETAETSCAEGENQEPVECSEDKGDKETEEAPGKSILEEKSMNSPPEVHISSIDTKDLPEIQQKETAETSCAEGENQAPVECSEDKEDKETEEATGKSIVEDKSMNSRPEVHISSIDTQDLPGVQRQATAETSCAEGENQEPVECGEDTEEATGKSILEEKSMTSPPEVHISSIDTKDLPEVQQKATAETSCPEGECSEDKETEEAKGKSILEDKSMTSLPEVHISSINTKDLPKVQQKVTAESSCTDRENREPVECNEDKETEDATGKSIIEEKSMTSLPELLDTSQVSADFNSESKQTIQREETKDGKTGISEPEEPNTDEDKDEEGEGDKQLRSESAYDHPVIVEASRDIHVKASPKKSHNILSGVGSKVKHSIAKVKKVITGKSSHPKPSSPK